MALKLLSTKNTLIIIMIKIFSSTLIMLAIFGKTIYPQTSCLFDNI